MWRHSSIADSWPGQLSSSAPEPSLLGRILRPWWSRLALLKPPDGHTFDVITNGTAPISRYRGPILPADRWASIACVRALERKPLAGARGARAGDN